MGAWAVRNLTRLAGYPLAGVVGSEIPVVQRASSWIAEGMPRNSEFLKAPDHDSVHSVVRRTCAEFA